MKTRLAIASLATLLLLGCATKEGAVTSTFKQMSVATFEYDVYRVCSSTLGVSCSLNPDQLTLVIDQTGTPEETQRGVVSVTQFYCRLSRSQRSDENTVLLIRPDGSRVGISCTQRVMEGRADVPLQPA